MDTSPRTKQQLEARAREALARLQVYEQSLPQSELVRSLRLQVEYILGFCAAPAEPDDDQRAAVNLGLVALRELQESDPALAQLLMDLDYAFKRWPLLA